MDGAASDPAPVISGVLQGSVLGPVLFLVFINDLPLQVSSQCRLFADDCIVYREVGCLPDCDKLQKDLTSLAEWELKWGMSFHPEKCSILRVHRKMSPLHFDYSLKGHTLAAETSSKYLGVSITSKLTWSDHVDKISKKGNSALGFLRRNLRISNEATKAAAYKTFVRPSLEYCSTVWNPHNDTEVRKIEMVQRRAARYVTGRHHNTSSVTSMLQHLQWETLESRRTKAQVAMLYKIINGLVDIRPEDHITRAPTRPRSPNDHQYRKFSTKTTYRQKSFFPRTVDVWNSLPSSIVNAPSFVSLKQGLADYNF